MSGTRLWAVLRFHLGSGGRIVLANTSAQVLVLVALVGLQPSAGRTLLLLAQGLGFGGGLSAAPWLLALWAAGNSHLGAGRMVTAVHGWHRHLPINSSEHRRSLLLAVMVCQAPVILLWLLLWTGAWAHGQPVRVVSLACLGVVSVAAAQTALPVARSWTRLVAIVALLVGPFLSWTMVLIALAGVFFCEIYGGPLARRRKPRVGVDRHHSPTGLPWLIAWRALGLRQMGTLVTAHLPVGAAWLFLRNNELTPEMARTGVRVGGSLALVILLLHLAAELRTRRPPWAWSRSLPWSARRRILSDATFLAAHAAPIVLICGWLEPWTLPALLVLLAYLVVRLASAMRRDADGPTRLGNFILWETLFAGLWISVSAWTSVPLAMLVVWAIHHGATQEQNLKVTRWRERHHLIDGDSES